MAESPITVTGGSGGIGARLDDMRTTAQALSSLTDELQQKATTAAGIGFTPDLVSSALLSPLTAATAEEKIAQAAGELLLFATEAGVTAVFLQGAATAYETVDKALAALAERGANTVTFVAGAAAIPLLLAGASAVTDDILVTFVTSGGSVDATQKALAAQLRALNVYAGEHPGVVDLIAKGAPGLVSGLTLPFAAAPGGLAALTALTGVPWPPRTYEQAVQSIIALGHRVRAFDDGGPITPDDLFVPPRPVGAMITPRSVSDLMKASAQLDASDGLDGTQNAYARIRVTKVPGDPPHYVVQIPSTQNWSPDGGATPNDLTADVQEMTNRQTALSTAVVAAMHKAGINPNDPVMLEGFSLGGITAGQLAADPGLPFNVTHVVTAGSPIANFDIPPTTKVLSLESNEDPVARLDGNGNPDSANWTTVHAPAPTLPGESGPPGIAGAHNADRYAKIADEATQAGNVSVDDWQKSASGFFGPGGVSTDYGAQRKG